MEFVFRFSGKTNELKSAGFSSLDRIEPQAVANLVRFNKILILS